MNGFRGAILPCLKGVASALLIVALSGCGGQSNDADDNGGESSASRGAESQTTAQANDNAPVEDSDTRTSRSESSMSIQRTAAQDESSDAPPENPGPISVSLCAEGLPTDGMWKCDPVFGDVNGDGFVDLAAIQRLGPGPRVWLGDGSGHWTESSNGLARTDGQSCGGGVRLHDVNNDGLLDLCVADHCSGVYIYLGDGQGNWDMVVSSMYPADVIPEDAYKDKFKGAESMAVGDVNKDGNADLLVGASDEAGVRLYLGDGTGRNWARRDGILPERGWATRVELHDVNGDGWLDAIASYSAGPRVWLNADEGKSWEDGSAGLPTPIMGGIFHGLAVGDVNGDDRNDIAVANWIDGPEVYLQQEDGSWSKTDDVFPQMMGGAYGLDLGDLDHDGNLDMVVTGRLNVDSGYIRGVFALRGDGDGNWEYLEHCGLPGTGLGAMAGAGLHDVNGDGTLDIAACSGLIVETVTEGRRKPIVPFNLLLWCNELRSRAAAVAPEG